MVGKNKPNRQLIKDIAEVYNWLNSQIEGHRDLAGRCCACGKCCDFDGFGHKLFITPPELIFLRANLHSETLKPMKAGRCPYNIKGRCSVYEHRFSACRIFSCKGDLDFQNELSEKALKKFKAICEQFQIPYRYTDLATAVGGSLIA
jgi:Fe-S-cluster containining protein